MKNRYIATTAVIFVVLSAGFFALGVWQPAYRFGLLETGNLIMAVLSLSAYAIVSKKMEGRPRAFVTGVSAASLLKLMVCMVSMLIYILIKRSEIHKPSIFVLFGVYAVYTVMETWLLSKMAKG